MFLESILPFIGQYGKSISFLGGFITGESVIITLAFLSAQGFLPLWYVLVFCTIGMYLSDFIPFTIGRFKFFRNFLEKEKYVRQVEKIEYHLQKYTKNNLFLILFYTKIIYGASIPALVYLGAKKTSYSKFSYYNLFVELIFVPFVVLIGWLTGKGFSFLAKIFENLRIAILFLILVIIILYFIRKWESQRLIKKQKL
ncbi:MAG: hypothetical protein QT05_C0051G0052 [archaeon GW2011_AR13]|nr:MAG: hypothetical protein QT05_C0051G0052 [archaeon GW2011_AR13]HIG94871.1 hypothetical protein [Nanoarchaeota archaeon]HIH63629.1 hypothetical protein [Nanoarchaeota archaeon]HIJ10116.1 hypothetical protein [Nanoarchaeota archaeon]